MLLGSFLTIGELSLLQEGVGSYVSQKELGPSNGNDASIYDTRMSFMSGTSCMFSSQFHTSGTTPKLMQPFLALSILHNTVFTHVSHQKLRENNQNADQELDGFPKSCGKGFLVSTNNHTSNLELGTKGAEGL